MAKRGEGDPRWIVEDRPDATNVNNWHWTEKNATPWSRQYIENALNGLVLEGDAGKITFSDVELEGEATASNRKAKLIFFYEMEVAMKWKGKTSDGKSVSGSLKVPNVSEEYTPDEFDVDVTMKSESTPARAKVKEMVRKEGAALVLGKLTEWYKDLRTEFTKGMILPTAKPADSSASQQAGVMIHSEKKISTSSSSATTEAGCLSPTQFTITDEFLCAPADLFLCLVDEDRVKAYTQADAKIDSKLGGAFQMFNNNVSGVIKDIVPNEKLVLAWRFNSWVEGHFSEVTIKLSEGKGSTLLTLAHSNIPMADSERAKVGWQRHQFDRIKAMFGYGSLAGMV